MAALFPGALPAAGTASSTATLAAAGHTALHNNVDDEVRAVATKVGTGSATPTSTTVLVGTGAGTSSWSQVNIASMVTGILPVANGGTSSSTSTGSGSVVLATTPTITGLTMTGGSVSATTDVTEVLKKVYPVGSLYINTTDSTNPATLLGFGTWTAFAAGRVLVGFNSGDTDFDTAEETGGAKTSTTDNGTASVVQAGADGAARFVWNQVNGSHTHSVSIVQPYIVVYMWKRTA